MLAGELGEVAGMPFQGIGSGSIPLACDAMADGAVFLIEIDALKGAWIMWAGTSRIDFLLGNPGDRAGPDEGCN